MQTQNRLNMLLLNATVVVFSFFAFTRHMTGGLSTF